MPVKLVEVTRSNIVESIHRGDFVVVTSGGEILMQGGDPRRLTFMRSTAKPFQALSYVEAGIVDKFKLDMKEVAIMCSSHSGEDIHIRVLKGLASKIGVDETELECGIHEPVNKEAWKELISSGGKLLKFHCNCSGKHLGLLAALIAMKKDTCGYYRKDHFIQGKVLRTISKFAGIDEKKIQKGIDGCGLPVYAMPVKNMAMAYANLCSNNFLNGEYLNSQNLIISSMTMFPEMVAGSGRFDTVLMKKFGDRVVGKIGAEGVYCLGILGKGIGMALKIDDGNNRAVSPVVLEILLALDVIKEEELEGMEEYRRPSIRNHRGEVLGEIRAVFRDGP